MLQSYLNTSSIYSTKFSKLARSSDLYMPNRCACISIHTDTNPDVRWNHSEIFPKPFFIFLEFLVQSYELSTSLVIFIDIVSPVSASFSHSFIIKWELSSNILIIIIIKVDDIIIVLNNFNWSLIQLELTGSTSH